MRRKEDVVERPQRAVGRKRLDLEDIERRTADAAGAECVDESIFVDDRSAATLMSTAVGFMRSISCTPIDRRVAAVSGVETTT
jgi:hypothetical protein